MSYSLLFVLNAPDTRNRRDYQEPSWTVVAMKEIKSWSEVPLGEIARPIAREVEVIPGRSYRTIGVKWWGEGAYERETIDGSQTATRTLSTVHDGDLIINKIWVTGGS
jgi:hypothetical protein